MTKRKIIEQDALVWLEKHKDLGSIITSLPDMEETQHTEEAYPKWFYAAAEKCILSTSENHPTIFYQTDRLYKGKRISKAFILMKAAEANNLQLVWHKIVLRRNIGKIDIRRPGFSHLLCFGDKGVKAGKATPDVFDAGGVLYPNGMGLQAATVALQAALYHGVKVCDPFCGRGTVPALAETMGFEKIIGVDIDEQQAEAARHTRLKKVTKPALKKKLSGFFE